MNNIFLTLLLCTFVLSQGIYKTCTYPLYTMSAQQTVNFCQPNAVLSSSISMAANIQSSYSNPLITMSVTAGGYTNSQSFSGNGFQYVIFASTASNTVTAITLTNNNNYPITMNGSLSYWQATSAPSTTSTVAPTLPSTLAPQSNSASSLFCSLATVLLCVAYLII